MPSAIVGPVASPSAVPMTTPSTSPMAHPVRQCSVALTAMPLTSIWCPAWSCTSTQRNGEGQNRTGDTTIFSRVLYQLSYLAY